MNWWILVTFGTGLGSGFMIGVPSEVWEMWTDAKLITFLGTYFQIVLPWITILCINSGRTLATIFNFLLATSLSQASDGQRGLWTITHCRTDGRKQNQKCAFTPTTKLLIRLHTIAEFPVINSFGKCSGKQLTDVLSTEEIATICLH